LFLNRADFSDLNLHNLCNLWIIISLKWPTDKDQKIRIIRI